MRTDAKLSRFDQLNHRLKLLPYSSESSEVYASRPMPKLVDSERSKFRYQLAAGAAILAVVLTFIAVRFQSKDYLISKPAKTSPDRSYTRMWFIADDALVGVTQRGAHFSIHQWGGEADRGWELDVTHATEELKWTIAPDLSRIAWLAGSTLQSAKMPQQSGAKLDPVSIELPDAPLAFSLLSDGSLAATFADSSVSRWNADTGAPLEEHNLNLKSLEQAMADGDYLAVSPTHANRMVLYRFRDGKEWTIVDDSPAPDPPYQIVLPAPGFMATLSSGRLRVGTTIRNSPGEVRSVVSHLDNMIATGDFENVFVVPDDENPYLLASAVPGSLVAAGEQHLAVSGPQGTRIFNLGTETRLTMGGRAIQWVGAGLGLLAGLLAFAPLLLAKLLALINQLIRGKKKKLKDFVPGKLADPPLELLKMCASGEGVLWAGAGLSAQAGVALRTNFIANVLQFAQIEKWVEAKEARKLTSLFTAGDAEAALDELVASTEPYRGQLIAYVRSAIPPFAVPSRSHELLWRIPFFCAVTTNYDNLLERLGQHWSFNVMTLKSQRPEGVANVPFLMKLFGDLSVPQTILLSRAEYQAAVPMSPVRDLIRDLFSARSLMFVGSSIEGLLADLSTLLLSTPTQRHFAVVGVSGADWQTKASELSKRYGIEVIACDADNISASLPEFLDKLVRGVEQIHREAGVVPSHLTLPA